MALDLGGVRRVVEKLLEDELRISRPPTAAIGPALDEETGQLDDEPDTHVWEGLGAVVPVGRPALVGPLDGGVAPLPRASAYHLLLPLDSPEVRQDDVVTVTGSRRAGGPRDPQIVGQRFRVAELQVGSFAVVRIVRVQLMRR